MWNLLDQDLREWIQQAYQPRYRNDYTWFCEEVLGQSEAIKVIRLQNSTSHKAPRTRSSSETNLLEVHYSGFPNGYMDIYAQEPSNKKKANQTHENIIFVVTC